MKCEDFKILLPEYLSGTLDLKTGKHIDEHVSGCESCRNELEAMSSVWSKLEMIPQEDPGPAVSTRFYAMMEAYRQGMENAPAKISWSEKLNGWLSGLLPRRPVYQLGFSAVMLVFGIVIGLRLNFTSRPDGEIVQLKDEISEMRQLVTLSLLNRSSANDRLRGVTMSRQLENPDERHLSALVKTLNSDPNVNIRMAAVTALSQFSDTLWVRNELVESLARQESPLVQIFLIDLLTEIREQKALEVLQSMIENPENIEPVKKRARLGMDKII